MKGIVKKTLVISAAILTALAASGYWYVFIAGVPQFDLAPAEKNTGLSFTVKTFSSTAMGSDRSYGIVLPPGYDQHPSKRYPVIFLLHGGHGNARDFQDKAALTSVLHDLYQKKRLPPSIVITPDGSDNRGSNPFWDPDYFDGENGNVGTLIGKELPEVVKSRYRTLPSPQFWAIGGNSSGGWGAFNIGLRNLNRFHILFSHTGYFFDKSGAANSPQQFVQQIPPAQRQQIRAYLDAGSADARYLAATRSFHQTLNQLGVTNDFRVYPGGHGIYGKNVGWNYWRTHLADSLSFVGKQFKGALKTAPVKLPTKLPETPLFVK
ncbi:MAG: esterase [Leptolyngbya sp.]|nr:MAG: esterase [Leptolyngbya sp.]